MADEEESLLSDFVMENEGGTPEVTPEAEPAVVAATTETPAPVPTGETTPVAAEAEPTTTTTPTPETDSATPGESTPAAAEAEPVPAADPATPGESTPAADQVVLDKKDDDLLDTQIKALMTKDNISEVDAIKKIGENLDADVPEEISIKKLYTDLYTELDWELGKEENAPEETIAGLKKHLQSIVTRNSIPTYASAETQAFDEYVKNNGDPKLFLDTMYGSADYSDLKVETEAQQRSVMAYSLKETHPTWSAEKIKSKIDILAEKELLADEAVDAVPELKSIGEQRTANLATQKADRIQALEDKITTNNVAITTAVNSAIEIAGYTPDQDEKNLFIQYMTIRDDAGTTKYDKELAEPGAKLAIAFLRFKGVDAQSLMESVEDVATKRVKDALARRSSESTPTGGSGVSAAPLIEEADKNFLEDFVLEQQ